MTIVELYRCCNNILPETPVQLFKRKEAKYYFDCKYTGLSVAKMTFDEILDDGLGALSIDLFSVSDIKGYDEPGLVEILLEVDEI